MSRAGPGDGDPRAIPYPSLIVLIGPPAAGKSTWAAEHFDARQILSTDVLRGMVGEHELDLGATDDAFELLDRMIDLRLGRKLTTVVDTTGLDANRRAAYLALAGRHDVPAVAVRFATSGAECRRRNRTRPHPVPVRALDAMVRRFRSVSPAIDDEAWSLVLDPAPNRSPEATRSTEQPRPEPSGAAEEQHEGGLRFGLHISSFEFPGGGDAIGPTLASVAASAEEAGFDSVWVMDHLIQIPQVGREWDAMLESYTTLGFLAAATSRCRLGALVSPVTFRNIGLLAKQVATLDVLSGGRAMAGVGAGSSPAEHAAYGMEFGSATERLDLLEDALQALPLLWGPGGPAFDGKAVSIPKAVGYPRPLQERVPIVVGGSGEKRTLRLAARFADGCNLFGDVKAVRRRIEALEAHCAAVGRDPAELDVGHLRTVVVARTSAELRDRIEALRPSDVGPERYRARVNAGTVADHVDDYTAFAEAGVRTAVVSTPDITSPGVMDSFAELISAFR